MMLSSELSILPTIHRKSRKRDRAAEFFLILSAIRWLMEREDIL